MMSLPPSPWRCVRFMIITSRLGWARYTCERRARGVRRKSTAAPEKEANNTEMWNDIIYRARRRCHRANGPRRSRATLPSVATASGEDRSGNGDGVARVANVARDYFVPTAVRQHLRRWWWSSSSSSIPETISSDSFHLFIKYNIHVYIFYILK